jgi:hypothetical protein
MGRFTSSLKKVNNNLTATQPYYAPTIATVPPRTTDLLGFGSSNPAPAATSIDLLDFGAPVAAPSANTRWRRLLLDAPLWNYCNDVGDFFDLCSVLNPISFTDWCKIAFLPYGRGVAAVTWEDFTPGRKLRVRKLLCWQIAFWTHCFLKFDRVRRRRCWCIESIDACNGNRCTMHCADDIILECLVIAGKSY